MLQSDIGSPLEKSMERPRGNLVGQYDRKEIVTAATKRRGAAIQCRIALFPLNGPADERAGVIC